MVDVLAAASAKTNHHRSRRALRFGRTSSRSRNRDRFSHIAPPSALVAASAIVVTPFVAASVVVVVTIIMRLQRPADADRLVNRSASSSAQSTKHLAGRALCIADRAAARRPCGAGGTPLIAK